MPHLAKACYGLSILFAVLHVFFVGLTNDNCSLLHYALLSIKGGLYTQWIQFNTPLAIALYVPPALAAVKLHLPAAAVLYGYAGILCGISLLITYRVLAGLEDTETRHIWVAAAASVLFIVPSLCFAFGDREHLVFVFALPWMLAMLLELPPSMATLLWAIPGFLLKPYNLLFFAALQLFGGPSRPWMKRIFAPASFLIAAACIVYVAILYACFPDYPEKLIPLMLTAYPYVYEPLLEKLKLGAPVTVIGMVLIFECIREPRERRFWYAFLAAGFTIYLCNAGWGYTLNLVFTPIWLLCFAMWRQAGSRISHRMPDFLIRGLSLLMIALTFFLSCDSLGKDMYNTSRHGYAKNYTYLPPAFYDELRAAAGNEFILLSTSLWATNIDVLGGTPHHVFAYDSLWPLPWLYAHPDDSRSGGIYSLVVPKLTEALKNYPQATLIVDASPVQYKMPDHTDLLAYFRKDASVNSELAGYRLTQTLDDCGDPLRDEDSRNVECRYTVWRRQTTKLQ